VTDLYNENYTSPQEEINEDISRWKASPCSLFSEINIVKMTIIVEEIYVQ
jgi:hypothetical protein